MTSDTEEDGPSHSQSGDSEGEQDNGEMVERSGLDSKSGSQEKSSNGQTKASSNAKDPSRPRRKKARRACYACQRAHLTCGKSTLEAVFLLLIIAVTGCSSRSQAMKGPARDASKGACKTPAKTECERKQSIFMMHPARR